MAMTGKKTGGKRLQLNTLLSVRTYANGFFRLLGHHEKWRYTDNIMSHGVGSPFLSKECDLLYQTIRRVNLGSKQTSKSIPVMSEDFVRFAATIANCERCAFADYVRRLTDGENFVEATTELCKVVALPITFKVVPELTRASVHRGEVVHLRHNELFPAAVCTHSIGLTST